MIKNEHKISIRDGHLNKEISFYNQSNIFKRNSKNNIIEPEQKNVKKIIKDYSIKEKEKELRDNRIFDNDDFREFNTNININKYSNDESESSVNFTKLSDTKKISFKEGVAQIDKKDNNVLNVLND